MLFPVLPPMAAYAAPCDNDSVIHVQLTPNTNGRGARSTSMDTYNLDVTCVHISSIGDRSLTTPAFAEAGWMENPHDEIIDCDQTDTKPITFTFYVRVNGTGNCWPATNGQTINDGTLHDYMVRDNNLDGNWVLSVDGDAKQSPDLGVFTTGQPIANAERRVSSDPNKVEIPNLKRMDANQNWVNWDFPLTVTDNDIDWDLCSDAAQNLILRVRQTC
jgi:hypothetical protein